MVKAFLQIFNYRSFIVNRHIYLSSCYAYSIFYNEGRGPVDFKVSRGNDKTIIEVKLSSNSQYLHGYEVQIEEYGKAERTNQMIYVLIDLAL